MNIGTDKYGGWEIDFFGFEDQQIETAQDRFGGKKRDALKDSDFLDSKKRSFPVMSCRDVKDAVSSWGRYTGSMTFDIFKERLMRKAKSLGCEASIPKKWKAEESKSNWMLTDKKELKRDSKKEKVEHEKDAIKDDKNKIKKLDKDKPSEKKSVEKHYLKKDEKHDKKNEKKFSDLTVRPTL